MSETYNVTFNIDEKYGYIAYNETTKAIKVHFADPDFCERIETWLAQEHEINTPDQGIGTANFSNKKYLAKNSKQDFQTVLTRIWEKQGLHIDWSFPAELI